jgi:hypothetical protein
MMHLPEGTGSSIDHDPQAVAFQRDMVDGPH